jgi:UPF0755 protein
MWRHVASNALTLIIVVLFLAGGVITWAVNQYQAPGPLASAICLRVESGSNMTEVRDDLGGRGALAHPWIFGAGAEYTGKATELKAGSFLIPAAATPAEIVEIVTRGGASTCGTQIIYTVGVGETLARVRELDPETGSFEEVVRFAPLSEEPPQEYLAFRAEPDTQYTVQVVEGVTSWQVITSLNALDILEGDVETIPAEGSLAPDSYGVLPGTQVEAVIARMASAQAQILAEAWAARADGVPVETPEEALVLASIVEKETAIAEERPLVSSVLVNRIRQGMRLQFDPTIIYGITRGVGLLDRPISNADIDGVTEQRTHGEILYNTYQIDGLPAGPIANPGRAAIEAALNPASTEYLFFVADGTGGHAFATNLEDHNANVARLRALEAEGAD